ncbi:molybdopterin-guanine dinucleotide biosynthesis protein B [Thermovibrio sp.]
MVPVVSFVGYHDSGKTTFASKVVEILTEKGYKVGVLKSTKHKEVIKDKPGTDSAKFKEAGAKGVAIVEPESVILFREVEVRDPEYLAFLLFPDFDVVICEGFKRSPLPKFEVIRKEIKEKALFRELENLLGVISDFKVEGVKNFPIDDPSLVASFIEEEFIKGVPKTSLFVNGRKVPLKRFVQESLKGVIEGYVSALKGIEPEVKRIEVKVRVDR